MLYTKCIFSELGVDDGERVSVMSRHTLNDGKTPDCRITPIRYNIWFQELAPPDNLVGSYLKGDISWKEYGVEYLIYLRKPDVSLKVEKLAKEALESTITLLCGEEKANKCHRRLLAEECKRFEPSLEIVHL